MNSTWLYHLIGNVKSMGLNDYLDIIIVDCNWEAIIC